MNKNFNYKIYFNFLNLLAKQLTKYYYSKLDKPFKISNKLKGKGYDPVTTSDKAFERFIRKKILDRFPGHQIMGEEYGFKKTKSDFSWVIDPIDGTRSFVTGNPTWSNLISLNYKGTPMVGLANFPKLKKYYLNKDEKNSYLFENGKKIKLNVNSKVSLKNAKIAAAFHGYLSFKKQKKIQKFIKIVNFPCFDALTYAQLAEGRLDVVAQCANKIWDVHAIIPIINAAGGILTTWKNENGKLAVNFLASSNKSNHKKILKLLKPAT